MAMQVADSSKCRTGAGAAPSQDRGFHFRFDLLLTSDLAAHMPPVKKTKRQHRLTRNVKARSQPRSPQAAGHHLGNKFLRHERQHADRDDQDPSTPRSRDHAVPAAATTDSSLKSLSPEVRLMQAEARIQAYEQYRQRSDRESLRRLEAVSRKNRRKALLLDRISLAVLERATGQKTFDDGYTLQTISTGELEAFAALGTDPPISGPASDSGSFILVDSQPTASDDVFGSISRHAHASLPPKLFVVPTLSYGKDSAGDSTTSSGRPLARVEEDSTGSFINQRLDASTYHSDSGEALEISQRSSLLAKLQDHDVASPERVVTQSWLEQQLAEAMGKKACDLRQEPAKDLPDLMGESEEYNEVAPCLVDVRDPKSEDFEIIGKEQVSEDDGYKGDAESEDEDELAQVSDKDAKTDWQSGIEGEQKEGEDWFDVVTESMITSRD